MREPLTPALRAPLSRVREVIAISPDLLHRRVPGYALQKTRSKASLD